MEEGCDFPVDALLVFTEEGGAHERDGSFDITACHICGIVLHRQP